MTLTPWQRTELAYIAESEHGRGGMEYVPRGLKAMADAGLVEIQGDRVRVTPAGRESLSATEEQP